MTIFLIGLIFIIILFCIKKLLNAIENKLIFFPTQITPSEIDNTIKIDPSIVNYKINTIDEEIIDALFLKNINSNKLILYCHGNAGNIYNRIHLFDKFKDTSSIIMFDYRGYGLSTGTPSEKGVHNDVLAVWNYCIDKLEFEPNNITLYGCSLGCSIVLWLGKYLVKNEVILPNNIIVESGFYNLADMISTFYSSYLVSIVNSKFNNIKYIKKIGNKINILIIHSKDDETINVKHAYKLKKHGKIDDNNLLIITGSHNSPNINETIMYKIRSFINEKNN